MYRPLVQPSRHLRKRETPQERKLWRLLRARNLEGLKFRRQYVIEPYIVDFCCPEKNLVIELDGGHHNHPDQKMKDNERDQYLKQKGFHIVRIWNSALEKDSRKILEYLYQILSSPSPQPSPQREREEVMK